MRGEKKKVEVRGRKERKTRGCTRGRGEKKVEGEMKSETRGARGER